MELNSTSHLYCTGEALVAFPTMAVVWQHTPSSIQTPLFAYRWRKHQLGYCQQLNWRILFNLTNSLTCLTLKAFPANGTVAGVGSNTLATISTLLQANSCNDESYGGMNAAWSSKTRFLSANCLASAYYYYYYHNLWLIKVNLWLFVTFSCHLIFKSIKIRILDCFQCKF